MAIRLIDKYLRNKIILFDIGAKGGTHELPKLASYTSVYGFEPNPYEFQKLIIPEGRKILYPEIQYFELALSDHKSVEPFHITNRPSYSSLLEFEKETFTRHLGLMRQYDEWVDDFNVKKTVNVQVTTLDIFCKENNLTNIDFLKLDTQGTELKILKGSGPLLNGISVIKCEVNFMRAYKGQSLFSEIDLFLRQNEFEFVDCIFYPDTLYNEAGNSKKRKLFDRPRFSGGGDVFYLNVSLNEENKILKAGLILAELGYLSESYSLLERQIRNRTEVEKIIQYLVKKPASRMVKDFIKDWLPPKISSLIKKAIGE